MEYSGDIFHTFLNLGSGIYLAVNGTVTSFPVFIQNILNCVLKTNEAFTCLERHGGKWKTKILYPFKHSTNICYNSHFIINPKAKSQNWSGNGNWANE